MSTLELRIPPAVLVIVLMGAMGTLAHKVTAPVTIPGQFVIAVALVTAGVFVALAGVMSFKSHKTTVNPTKPEQSSKLVTTGIYRFSRNPMYLGFLLMLTGWGVYLANWASLVMLPVFVVYMNRFQIEPEERALKLLFGPVFEVYSLKVRRWL